MGIVGGSMLGRYEVIRHLASGGMADLLLARARGLEGFERHVVIKRIRADAEDDQAFIDMFLVEARLAGALHHHNIVQVHDVGEENGKPYFAMEYVHGEDLRRLLALVVEKGQQIPFPVVVTIVTAVARALHHAHEQRSADQQTLGIVHRDVSPANIVVGYDGNVKVLDFGIARAAMRRTETQAGMLKGKAPYMAPEQCTGAAVDRRSDVFGLGIVLYELVTARRLFKADNDFSTMSMVVNGSFPKPSTIRKDLPPDLERIILRALARDPGARYQTAEQMFTALEQLALLAEWRTSASSLATYLTQMFGTRTEPWLEKEVIAPAVNVDFDGTRPGLALAPVETGKSAVPSPTAASPSTPMTRARVDAQGSNGVPAAAEVGVSNGVRIPEASGPAKGGKVPLKPVPAKPIATRARPKTVQVPVPKSSAATATTEALPTTKSAPVTPEVVPITTGTAAPSEVATPDAAKVATKLDPKPAAKADAKVETKPLRSLSKLPGKTEPALPSRAATEEVVSPIMDPEDTHTEAMALPPAISPHARRQPKPLPPPNVAKSIAAKPADPPAVEPPALPPAPTAVRPSASVAGVAASQTIPGTGVATEREEATEISSVPESPFSSRRADPTAIVEPLPSPLVNDAPRARRKSTAPLDSMMLVEETDQLVAPRRPRWMVPAIGGGLLVLVIVVIAIARSGGNPALDEAPATASVPTKPAPMPAPAAVPTDEVRSEARPRTWANSQEPASVGRAAPVDPEPTPVPVAPAPEPTLESDPVAEPVAVVPAEPPPSTPAAMVTPPTEPEITPAIAVTKSEPKPVVKPAVAVTKPMPKPVVKPTPKPVAVAKTKPAPKPVAVAKPKPKAVGKPLPKPKWNPNTLFPNKK